MRFEPWTTALGLVILAGCDGGKQAPAPAGSAHPVVTAASAAASVTPPAGASTSAAASADAPVDPKRVGVVAGPYPSAKVAAAVNPRNALPYAGPTGTVRGVVRLTGDPAPPTSFAFPSKCGEASATYGKLFRVGQGGTLADALVTVIGYDGFVAEVHEAKRVAIHGCAFSKRTLAVTYGQRIEVTNTDAIESYMPYLDGAPSKAVMVAVPGGEPIKLYPAEPAAQYKLRDELDKPWLTADVFVLKFPTHDVTGLDGRYEITRVPAGHVRVSVYLPAIEWRADKELDVKEGDNVADFELAYERGKPDAGAPKK
jgi:hypothetical protein